MRGISVFAGKVSGNLRAEFGNFGGDLVTGVNGIPLVDQPTQVGRDVFAAIQAASHATLTIERRGQTRDITVDTAQDYSGDGEGNR